MPNFYISEALIHSRKPKSTDFLLILPKMHEHTDAWDPSVPTSTPGMCFAFKLMSSCQGWLPSVPAGTEAVGVYLESSGELLKTQRPGSHLGKRQQDLSQVGTPGYSDAQSGPRTASLVFAASVVTSNLCDHTVTFCANIAQSCCECLVV